MGTGIDQTAPAKKEMLASGVARSLTQNLPLIGPVTGAKWISGHQFQTQSPPGAEKEPYTAFPMDVLVDSSGGFIMAKHNGENYDTRPSAREVESLLSEFPGGAARRSPPPKFERPASLFKNAVLARVPWEDTSLGNRLAIQQYGLRRNYHVNFSTHFEESHFLLEVTFQDGASPRQIMVSRTTNGLTFERGGINSRGEGIDIGNAVRGANAHGAMVITYAADFSVSPAHGYGSWMYLMEPWAGACPWPADKLDPDYGTNHLDEFLIPVQFHGDMEQFFQPVHSIHDPFEFRRQAAEGRKAARLARERAGNRGEK